MQTEKAKDHSDESRIRTIVAKVQDPHREMRAVVINPPAQDAFSRANAPRILVPANPEAVERTEAPQVNRIHPVMRCIEIVVASIALVLTLPIQLAVAFIIWRGTPGPLLFRQQRVGIDAKNFTFVKFRTMYADARERFPELYAYKYDRSELETLKFKVEDDPRISPQGVWLRKTSLDELPNFWNVLTGDMALVGPRPEIPEMLPYYKGEELKKFSVRPGVTGLAQTSGRGRLSFKDTVALDLEYVENQSLWGDIKILLNTVVMVFRHYGAF